MGVDTKVVEYVWCGYAQFSFKNSKLKTTMFEYVLSVFHRRKLVWMLVYCCISGLLLLYTTIENWRSGLHKDDKKDV